MSASPSRSRQPSESGSRDGGSGSRVRRRSGTPENITNLYAERNSRKLSDYGGVSGGNKG